MGLVDRILGRQSRGAAKPELSPEIEVEATEIQEADPQPTSSDRWYVPQDGNRDCFVGTDGFPPLHLILYGDTQGEAVLRLCEDASGLLVGPTDKRLTRAGVFVSQLRGKAYHREACRAGDFRPGRPVQLVREPQNEFDPHAVAVYDETGQHLAAYVNKQKARTLARLMDAGKPVQTVSIRGTGSGTSSDQIAVLAASPKVLRRLLEPRPSHLPPTTHQL